MGAGIVGTLALIYLGFTALLVAAAVSIVRKAGYSGWWVAVGAVPLANIVLLFAFAFADWPALRDLRRAQSAPATGGADSRFGQLPPAPEPAPAVPTPPTYPSEPVYAQPAYAVPNQPAPSAPPPRFPGYRDPNVLPER